MPEGRFFWLDTGAKETIDYRKPSEPFLLPYKRGIVRAVLRLCQFPQVQTHLRSTCALEYLTLSTCIDTRQTATPGQGTGVKSNVPPALIPMRRRQGSFPAVFPFSIYHFPCPFSPRSTLARSLHRPLPPLRSVVSGYSASPDSSP